MQSLKGFLDYTEYLANTSTQNRDMNSGKAIQEKILKSNRVSEI